MHKLKGSHRLLPFLPLWMEQAVRFFFVGAVNTLVGYVLYALFLWLGLKPWLALLAGNSISVIFAFFSTGHFVYGRLGRKAIIRYVTAWFFMYLLNLALLSQVLGMGVNKYLAQAILVPFMAMLSFLIGKFWVYRPAHQPAP